MAISRPCSFVHGIAPPSRTLAYASTNADTPTRKAPISSAAPSAAKPSRTRSLRVRNPGVRHSAPPRPPGTPGESGAPRSLSGAPGTSTSTSSPPAAPTSRASAPARPLALASSAFTRRCTSSDAALGSLSRDLAPSAPPRPPPPRGEAGIPARSRHPPSLAVHGCVTGVTHTCQ